MAAPIVQYVVVRSDLLNVLNWSAGAVLAQACHASTAALHLFRDDECTVSYLNRIDEMHKVILDVSIYVYYHPVMASKPLQEITKLFQSS